MNITHKELRERFISDCNIPLQLYHSPYFEERIELLNHNYKAKDKWIKLNHLINDKFNSKPQAFLDEYGEVRDNIINTIFNSQSFLNFSNDEDLNTKFGGLNRFPAKNLYTCEQAMVGNYFLSIDLKKANFQALKFYDRNIVLNSDSYEELIYKFTDLEYIAESKYTRQVVFGKLNPKRTIIVENYIIDSIINHELIQNNILPNFDVFSVNTDEVIFKLKPNMVNEFEKITVDSLKEITTNIKDVLNFDVKIEKFILIPYQFKLGFSNTTVNVFEKENFNDLTTNELKCVSSIYFPQIYKLLNQLEVTDNDLVFYNNHELVKFIHPLELIK